MGLQYEGSGGRLRGDPAVEQIDAPGRPPIVLADEPTGNLDSKSGESVMQMLEELHAGGSTICLATHNPDYIARTARRIYLFDGRIAPKPTA